ncbi:hypothetical protein JD844_005840 [Phrynosoma platyrhinos]|uniref:Uncharacterized protein n=1 Tax=Phrynosoma platyrhinos TaxID=52577 RepID=A0ABQ7TPX1_PHRPL|nr:hypothetical protein JD844_005840 [Phrynosoma platyrhinos]
MTLYTPHVYSTSLCKEEGGAESSSNEIYRGSQGSTFCKGVQVANSIMEVAGAVTFFLVIYLSYLAIIITKRKLSQKGRLPPGPTPLPLIGNFLQIKSSETLKSLLRLHEKYGPVFTVYFGTRPIVVLCGHKAVKEALIDKAEEFSGRSTHPTLERTFKGYGVIYSNGERWKQLRRFSLTVLRDFGMGKKTIHERIQEEAQFLLEEFRKTDGELRCN